MTRWMMREESPKTPRTEDDYNSNTESWHNHKSTVISQMKPLSNVQTRQREREKEGCSSVDRTRSGCRETDELWEDQLSQTVAGVRRLLVNNRVLLIKEGRTGKNGLSCWRVTMFRSDMDHRCYVPDYWQSETVRKIKKMLGRKCQNKSSSEPKSKQINPVSGLNRDCSKHGLKPLLLYNVYHSNDCGVVLSAIKVERDRVWCILLQRLFIYHRRVHSLQPAVQGHHCVSDLPDMLSPISNSHMPLYCFARYCTSQFKATKAAVMPLALAGRVSPNRCETTKIKCLQKIPFFPHQITIPVESEEGTGRAPVRFSHLSVTVETANSDVKYPSPWEQKEMERARREEEMYGISRGCH